MCKNMIGGICTTREIHIGDGSSVIGMDVRKNDGRKLRPDERIYKGGGRWQNSNQRNREIDREKRAKARAARLRLAEQKRQRLRQSRPTPTPTVKLKPTVKIVKGVTPQQPKETPAQRRKRIRLEKIAKKKQKTTPTATQRPGGPGRKKPCVRTVPEPRRSRGRPTRTRSSTGGGLTLIGQVAIVMAVLGVAAVVAPVASGVFATVAALAAWLPTVLGILAGTGLGLGVVAVGAVVAHEYDVPARAADWTRDRWHVYRTRHRALEARRDELAAVLEAERPAWAPAAPIALGPATPSSPEAVGEAEHDRLVRAWTPGTYVPDLAPEWRRAAKEG